MQDCKGCKWLDTTRPPRALGYCMNWDNIISPIDRARYEVNPRCPLYGTANAVSNKAKE